MKSQTSDAGEHTVLCYICRQPISGYVGRYRSEPIHPGCQTEQG